MMLGNAKENVENQNANQKCLAQPTVGIKAGDLRKKRVGLAVVSNAITNSLCIDSDKKIAYEEKRVIGVEPCKMAKICVGDESSGLDPPEDQEAHEEQTASESQCIQSDCSPRSKRFENEEYIDYDYDVMMADDPNSVSEYAFDIFRYSREREKYFKVLAYAHRQPQITASVRAVLVDWMVELQEFFELNHETFYTAVKVLDLYVANERPLQTSQLQLVGATALFIACKYEELYPPLVDDIVYVCQDVKNRRHVFGLERHILKTIGFDLGFPLAYSFLRRYARVIHCDFPTLTLARFYLETCAMFYAFLSVPDSLMAAACLLLAIRVKKFGDWGSVLRKYSGYQLEEVEPLMWHVNHAMVMRPIAHKNLKVVFKKYSSDIFYGVARLPLLKDLLSPNFPIGPPAELSFTNL